MPKVQKHGIDRFVVPTKALEENFFFFHFPVSCGCQLSLASFVIYYHLPAKVCILVLEAFREGEDDMTHSWIEVILRSFLFILIG